MRENIALPLALSKVKAREVESRVEEIAKKFGIDHILNQYPYEASGGQVQPRGIKSDCNKSKYDFGDEPTGALDSKSATDLLESMKTLNEKDLVTILMVTHDAFAASYCKRVVFIKDGKLYKELHRKEMTRKQFFQQIIDMMSSISGCKK